MTTKNLSYLIAIGERTGLKGKARVTTISLAGVFGLSQQSASRKMRELEYDGYIKRQSTPSGLIISLTGKGIDTLNETKNSLKKIFNMTSVASLKGKVVTGLGEGRFYTEMKSYKKQFFELLGITPFPGTLNLRVDEHERLEFLLSRDKIVIKGFKSKERTFGSLNAYPVAVNGKRGAAIVPKRTHHEGTILEIISKDNLRHILKLKDGDEVKLK
jgi:riboflavin kinase